MTLSNFDLKELATKLRLGKVDIIMQDQLSNFEIDVENGKYIINLGKMSDPRTRGGTHWVGLQCRNKGECVYFDSFGMPMPKDIEAFAKSDRRIKKIGYNRKIIQALESSLCGWHTLAFLTYNSRSTKDSLLESANDFTNVYSTDVDFNAGRIRELINHWIPTNFPKRLFDLLMEKIIYT